MARCRDCKLYGLPGDYHADANNLARKAWRALARGQGCT